MVKMIRMIRMFHQFLLLTLPLDVAWGFHFSMLVPWGVCDVFVLLRGKMMIIIFGTCLPRWSIEGIYTVHHQRPSEYSYDKSVYSGIYYTITFFHGCFRRADHQGRFIHLAWPHTHSFCSNELIHDTAMQPTLSNKHNNGELYTITN